jgi:hypothetical protein
MLSILDKVDFSADVSTVERLDLLEDIKKEPPPQQPSATKPKKYSKNILHLVLVLSGLALLATVVSALFYYFGEYQHKQLL